jgi:hypothetical protein
MPRASNATPFLFCVQVMTGVILDTVSFPLLYVCQGGIITHLTWQLRWCVVLATLRRCVVSDVTLANAARSDAGQLACRNLNRE